MSTDNGLGFRGLFEGPLHPLDATRSDILWGYLGVLAMLLSAWVTLCLMFRVLLG